MTPLLFGSAAAPLYGMYHPPEAAPKDMGVVLCYPFGQEYMRAHRAYRQLSLLLAKKGFHVLRFDYRGTGDSSGDIDDVSVDDWITDVRSAVSELKELSDVSRMSVVGLRLGALVAALACEQGDGTDQLIVWDPVVSGQQYVDELLAEIAAEVPDSYSPHSGNRELAGGTLHYNGFVMPASLRNALGQLSLDAILPASVDRVLQLVSHEEPRFFRLRDAWRAHPSFRYQYTPGPHDWNFVDAFGGILLPQPLIQAIVAWLTAQEDQ